MLSKKSKIKSIRKISNSESCYDLTVGNSGRYFANNILVHNTDGQQLSISWKDGKVVAARNKGTLKNYGEHAMDIDGVASMFAGRGDLTTVFVKAMEDISNAISSLSDKDKDKYFANGKKFASMEIITPATQNTVPYGLDMLVFHGVIEYDEKGNAIDEDKQAGRDLGKLIKDVNAHMQSMFYVRGPQDMDIKPFVNTKARLSYYKKAYNKILKDNDINSSSTIGDYATKRTIERLSQEFNKHGMDIPLDVTTQLVPRVLGINKSYTVRNIRRDLDKDTADWYIEFEKKNHRTIKRWVYAPLENLYIEVGTEFMHNMTTFLSANPTAAAEEMRKEIDAAIKTIRETGSEEDLRKLEHELSRITAAGGLDRIVPTEGITFVYKGTLYKYTGIFAPVHQIRGMVAYR